MRGPLFFGWGFELPKDRSFAWKRALSGFRRGLVRQAREKAV
ncbi:hypothetical protein BH23PLA1_BH23PLA1_02210 [soil metagenome]